jgi:rhodanese-related sulfurtransferase
LTATYFHLSKDRMKFVLDNIYLIAIAVVSGAMLLWPMLRRGGGGAAVSTTEATQLINREDALMVDVRDQDAFAKAHILNARSVPMSQIVARCQELASHKQKPLIVYCDSGSRSLAAAAIFRKEGFTRVQSLNGGLQAWQQAGLPVQS